MQIQLLGTGAADGMPGLYCLCPTCALARQRGGKNLRSRASALINTDLKIDLPPDTSHHALTKGLQMGHVHTLLFTHGHDDHFCLSELQYLGRHFISKPAQPLRILAPADVIARIETEFQNKDLPICLQALRAEHSFKVRGYTITPLLANHVKDIECFNYLIEEDQTRETVLYATDTGWWQETTWNFLENRSADAVVMECGTGPLENYYEGHLSVNQLISARQKLIFQNTISETTPFVATHLSHTGDFLHEDYERVFSPHRILTGHDALTFSPRSSFTF